MSYTPCSFVEFSSGTVSFESASIVASTNKITVMPLPGAAPMFGAALVGLGIAGDGFRRKTRKAA